MVYLTAQDICIDEPFSIYHAQMSWGDILRFLKPTNNPPLFEMLLHFWIKLFGISPFSVRFLPLLFGSLAVIFIYKIGTRFFSVSVGVGAGLLYCFSTHSIYYSHDCRTYTLLLFLTTVSAYYTLRIIKENYQTSVIVLWSLVNLLMIYSHYFGFIILFFELLAVMVQARRQLKFVLFGLCCVVLFYLPQLFILIKRFSASTADGTWLKEPVGLESIYNMLWTFSNMPLTTVICLLLILVTIVKYFIAKNEVQTQRQSSNRLIYFAFFVPFFMMFCISFKVPVYNARYLFFLLPFYYLSLAVMVDNLFGKNKIKWIAMSILVFLFVITVNLNPDKKRDSKAVTEFIKANKHPGDLVIICTHEFLTNFAYYYNPDYFRTLSNMEYDGLEAKLNAENIYPLRRISEINSSKIDEHKRILYLDAGADFSNPGNKVLQTLQEKFRVTATKKFEEIFTVYTFEK